MGDENHDNDICVMDSVTENEKVLQWLERRNREVRVRIDRVPFRDLKGWRFDAGTGDLVHQSGRFFSVVGLNVYTNTGTVSRWTQPIINQPEVGILGILCKEFDGVPHYLMQAKIEPGNVNCVQLSPTVQATRSNYMQVHGGKRPAYLDYFLNAASDQIVLDQLQSEQGARFYRKRNRNMIVRTEDDVACGEDFMWLTLPQIKDLMRHDNTVNMDARTVFSGLREAGADRSLDGLLSVDEILHRVSHLKGKYELTAERIGLRDVADWTVAEDEIVRKDRRFFRVIGVDVTIENREVAHWSQPLVEPMQEGLCGLFAKRLDGVMHYLLQAKVECGNFDVVELAPTIQCLTGPYLNPIGYVPRFLPEFLEGRIPGRKLVDVLQSEEGGRFYHEQNRNVVIELDESFEIDESENFLWLTMPQIKEFLRFNNYLNIQVRSLVSML